MKKFGTPTFAAPAGASVNVGLAGVGGCGAACPAPRAGAGVGTLPASDWTLPAAFCTASLTPPDFFLPDPGEPLVPPRLS